MIIGISGKKGTGKTTLAQQIIQAHPEYSIQSYAKILKEIVGLILNIPADDMDLPEVKSLPSGIKGWRIVKKSGQENPVPLVYGSAKAAIDDMVKYKLLADKYETKIFEPTVREVLQFVGTDLFRDRFHPETWTSALMRRYTPDQNWLIADVRFPNEAKAIRDKGGIVIRVERPGEYKDLHPSETALDDYTFDEVFYNDGTVEDLLNKFESYYERLEQR